MVSNINTTAEEFLTGHNLAPEEITQLNATGITIEQIRGHESGQEYFILGITAEEVGTRHAGVQFDFNDLEAEFKKVVTDYGESINKTTKSYALEFAVKVIYEVGPASRQVKKGTSDKKWKFRFIKHEGAKAVFTTVYIASFKNAVPPLAKPIVVQNTLLLTMKQASLLAQSTFADAIKLCITDDLVLMTPLCGAIFSKNNLEELSELIHPAAEGDKRGATLVTLSQSCQSGGHYLRESVCAVAVVAAVCATRNMTDAKVRDQIITKTYKQYVASGKQFDASLYENLCKFATGGVPAEHSAKRLIDRYEAVQKSIPAYQILRAAQSSGITTVPSNVQQPGQFADKSGFEKPGPSGSKN